MGRRQLRIKKDDANFVINELLRLYPDAKAELNYSTPFELLIATMLSAQCTDVRVNQTTEILYDIANTPETIYEMGYDSLSKIIKPCGLYQSKAKNIIGTCKTLIEDFNSEVPQSIDTLVTFPGVGKKTANVVVSNAFDIPAIAVDTHVFRVSNRIGLVHASDVKKTEDELQKVIDRELWTKTHHTLIFHGRRVCSARKPKCEDCTINSVCLYYRYEVK